MNGRNVIIKVNNVAIAACKSSTINISCDAIEVASTSSGQFREYIPGRKSWSIENSVYVATLPELLSIGTSVTVKITDESGNNLSGSGIITSRTASAEVGRRFSGTISIQGSGPLTQV